ncbi:hypothetical protein [Streptomyces sp. URMC 123]|uniref:hypothetical protein n=1 Tax=Streptomyces sp. URMC 123 TaxID=3423403 RepID=UPI003F1D8449
MASPHSLPGPAARVLLRAGLLASAAGAALGVAPSAAAAGAPEPMGTPTTAETPIGTLDTSLIHAPEPTLRAGVAHAVAPLKTLQLDPLANTGVDPLDNAVGTQVADFRPVGTDAVTGPVARGATLSTLPTVGPLVDTLPG